jgi:hypothetical protein
MECRQNGRKDSVKLKVCMAMSCSEEEYDACTLTVLHITTLFILHFVIRLFSRSLSP